MVDRQTPTVESDEELDRDAEATRVAGEAPGVSQSADASAAPDRAPEETARPAEAGARPAPATAAAATAAAATAPSQQAVGEAAETALFDRDATQGYEDRWVVIQTQFVDEPRAAVEQAEALVGEVVQALTESFKRERQDLEAHWSGDQDVSTEELRQAIRRYRSFFNRLLSL